jgi:hypothetical protein
MNGNPPEADKPRQSLTLGFNERFNLEILGSYL